MVFSTFSIAIMSKENDEGSGTQRTDTSLLPGARGPEDRGVVNAGFESSVYLNDNMSSEHPDITIECPEVDLETQVEICSFRRKSSLEDRTTKEDDTKRKYSETDVNVNALPCVSNGMHSNADGESVQDNDLNGEIHDIDLTNRNGTNGLVSNRTNGHIVNKTIEHAANGHDANGTNGHDANGTNGHVSYGVNGHVSYGVNGHAINGKEEPSVHYNDVREKDIDVLVEDVPMYIPHVASRTKKGLQIGSENFISDEDLHLSATLVHDAMQGRWSDLKTEPRYIRSYNLYKSFPMRVLLFVAVAIDLGLAFFEKPAVQHLELPYWATMSVELLCLSYFTVRLVHHGHWRLRRSFWKDVKTVLTLIILVATLGDMIAYVVLTNVKQDANPIRWSRPLRPILVINYSDGRQLKRAWRNIRLTIQQILHVIILFYFFIVVFSLVAFKMFQNRPDIVFPDGRPYFKSYDESFWQLYVLVTTANNPDVMLPAYNKNRWYCLFFTCYVVLCLYLMLNILLAVTYYNYRENMKEELKQSAKQKRRVLNQAFEVIKINKEGKEMITYKTWNRLIKLAQPGKTKNQMDLLMLVLDTDRSGYIDRRQFMSVADLLNVPLSEVEGRKTLLERHFPDMYNSVISRAIRTVVESVFFRLFYDVLVCGNIILLAMSISYADWAFFALYLLEIILKWYVYGTKRYFGSFMNWVDVVVTMLSLFLLVVNELPMENRGQINADALSVINVFRIFRVLRCLVHFNRFKIILSAVVNVSLSIITYCGILIIVFYLFAMIGMEIFAYKISFLGYNQHNITEEQLNCGNEALNGSAFAANRYCQINFNDIVNSYVLLSTLLIVNNWHIFAEGFVLVTSKLARIYFMSFHLCVAVVTVNILTAFILDIFMYEYTLSSLGKHFSKVEMTIRELGLGIDDDTRQEIIEEEDKTEDETSPKHRAGDKLDSPKRRMAQRFSQLTQRRKRSVAAPTLSKYSGVRFHVKKRGWARLELLLQQLFELEEDDGEEQNDQNTDVTVDSIQSRH